MLTARMGGMLDFWPSLLLLMVERFGFRVKGLGRVLSPGKMQGPPGKIQRPPGKIQASPGKIQEPPSKMEEVPSKIQGPY